MDEAKGGWLPYSDDDWEVMIEGRSDGDCGDDDDDDVVWGAASVVVCFMCMGRC